MTYNILSIDLEEYFCAHNLVKTVPPEAWDRQPLRVEKNVERMLDLFDEFHCEATFFAFFVLGWVAERLPDLVRKIDARGHEIATHGYNHSLLTEQTPDQFEGDLKRALAVTQPLVQQQIRGYRAPSFTITPKTTWAWEVLQKHGISYDSSVFPIKGHPDYGFPDASLSMYPVSPALTEVPISCATFGSTRFPSSGGAYFRIFPYFITRLLYARCIKQGRRVIFYLHPWEIDPDQPRYRLSVIGGWRHYHNLKKTEKRLRRMLSEFQFTSFRKALSL
jgi:polysaccharide deacetylase family protein (PEP-CTERM system associated)